MPQLTYTEQEMQAAIRIAYATAVRDILIGLRDPTLADESVTDEEVAHCNSLITDPGKLQQTVQAVKEIATNYARLEPYTSRKRASR